VIHSVVNTLVYEPVVQCDPKTELVLAPLPAKKQLWEADDAASWKAEIERERGPPTNFALAASGELVKLAEGYIYCDHAATLNGPLNARDLWTGTGNWQDWCLGMDGFGGLVMLTASLIA
jgi:hypothetical protein